MSLLLWGILPYVMVAVLIGGLLWRYRYDQFGWTTRSSQLYESRLLRIGSPLFHFGILVVIVGRVAGLVILAPLTHWLISLSQGTGHHPLPVAVCVLAAMTYYAATARYESRHPSAEIIEGIVVSRHARLSVIYGA